MSVIRPYLLAACLIVVLPTAVRAQEKKGLDKAGTVRLDRYGDPLPEGAVARFGTVRFRHGGHLQALLAYSPDGKMLASAAYGRTLCLWDAASGRERFSHGRFGESFYGSPSGLTFSPNGKVLAVSINCALNPPGAHSIHLYATADGRELPYAEARGAGLAFSPDGKKLAVAQPDFGVSIWDVNTARVVRRLRCRSSGAEAVAFSSDGKSLVSAARYGTMSCWDLATGKETKRFPDDHYAQCLAFSRDGKLLACGDDSVIRLRDTVTGKRLRVFGKALTMTWSVAISPDGKLLAAACGDSSRALQADGAIYLWEIATGKELQRWETEPSKARAVAFSPDGKTLAWIAGGVIRFWDVGSGKEVQARKELPSPALGITFLNSGKTLASLAGREVLAWNLASGKSRLLGALPVKAYHSAILSPDARVVATIAPSRSAFQLWDVTTGKELHIFGRQADAAHGLNFSSDGKLLAVAGFYGPLRLWDVATGKVRPDSSIPPTSGMDFSRDGKLLATCGGMIRLWEIRDKVRLVRSWKSDLENIYAFSISPDGRWLTLCGNVGSDILVRLWNTSMGTEIGPLEEVKKVRMGYNYLFSPDSRLLVEGGNQDTIRIWEVFSCQKVCQFRGHHSGILHLAFTPDGRTLASAGGDCTILIWDLPARLGAVGQPSAKDAEVLWAELAGHASKAYRAVWLLASAPELALPLLRKRVRPAQLPENARLNRLIAGLGNDRFTVRRQAAKELEDLDELAEPALRKALAAKPALEVTRRLEQLLEKCLPRALPSGERLRQLRALAVLEAIRTPEARRFLEELAGGAPQARLTRAARAVLARLDGADIGKGSKK